MSPAMNAPPIVDLSAIDAESFYQELTLIRRDLEASLGPEDLQHLAKIERWGRIATAIGAATAGLGPNPVSAVGLSLGRSTRWLLMHHVGHRGYDKVPGVAPRHTSRVFAKGLRRFVDWPDWMLPEAWVYEHNVLHHTHTGEADDPDLIERNTEDLRTQPEPVRYGVMGLLALTWRASYYAPKTLRVFLERGKPSPSGEPSTHLRDLWLRSYLPYAALQFGLFPLLYLPLGPWAVASAWSNSVLADVLTNLHTFFVVGPNHTGADVPRFDERPLSRAERAVRQVAGSVNYRTGGDLADYAQLWLNYQIEHHVFPDLPMSAYQRAQPRVRALCEKYGVPYIQESVFVRFAKMLDIAVGRAKMPRGISRRGAEAEVSVAAE
jgi:fatty acid desaturase